MGIYKNNNGTLEKFSGSTQVDSALSADSENPVQNKAIDAAIKNLSQAIEQANQLITNLQALRASPTTYGMVKVTDSAVVADSTGLALAATEKNATIAGTLANQISSLNTDLFFDIRNLISYPADEYGEKWSGNYLSPAQLFVHKITKQCWLAGSFIHTSSDAPVTNEFVLSFRSSGEFVSLLGIKPILVCSFHNIVYAGFVLTYDSNVKKYKILCFPENTALKNMTHNDEVILLNSF